MQTILVTDDPQSWAFLEDIAPVIQASSYLSDDEYHQNKSMRVMNLCQSYGYQSIGYYVSLLAHARGHKALPSVHSIQDVLSASLSKRISQDINDEIQSSLASIKGDSFVLSVYFGQNMAKRHAALARHLHGLFPLPLLRFTLEKRKEWHIKSLKPLSLQETPDHHMEFMQEAAKSYLSKKRLHQWRKKQRFHDLAILVDSSEPNAPSNKKALELFIHAGEEFGINVDLIDKNDIKNIGEYDALFIRTTTAVNHYTYRIARCAAQENLVVIDDPESIIKCTNKVYLAELLKTHQILTPETIFISKHDKVLPNIQFPCVLKKPDSAFSHGVVKLENVKDLSKTLTQFFKTSDLVLVQPFIPTAFDWRIGILDNKPLYACRYYMAQGHWQIYNWLESEEKIEGEHETIPLQHVPEAVIKTALKSTRLIGDSLYGVDIKHYNEQYYVMEINDNPNIDHGIEDKLLGKHLYEEVMQVFLQRIRRKHGYA